MTISDQLTNLIQLKSDLANNLISKGITGISTSDKFSILIPKVLDLQPYVRTNKITIYYGGSYSPVNIHWRPPGGTWTTSPGTAMTTSTKYTGYPYEITLDLLDKTSIECCFNNGSSWDSNGGTNYTCQVGSFKFKNGVFTAI